MAQVPTHNKLGFPVVACDRCLGDGEMDHYRHVHGGTCFKCAGARVVVRPGKAAKAYKQYLEDLAALRATTVGELEIGQVFALGDSRSVARWAIYEGLELDKYDQAVLLTNKGKIGLGGKQATPELALEQAKGWSARTAAKLDPAPYLQGL